MMNDTMQKYLRDMKYKAPEQIAEDFTLLLSTIEVQAEDLKNSTPNAKILELIDKCKKRENDKHRPPFEQEAYGLMAYDLEQLIKPEGE